MGFLMVSCQDEFSQILRPLHPRERYLSMPVSKPKIIAHRQLKRFTLRPFSTIWRPASGISGTFPSAEPN